MFIYTENDTESDKRIKNTSSQYKKNEYKNTVPKVPQHRECSKIEK